MKKIWKWRIALSLLLGMYIYLAYLLVNRGVVGEVAYGGMTGFAVSYGGAGVAQVVLFSFLVIIVLTLLLIYTRKYV